MIFTVNHVYGSMLPKIRWQRDFFNKKNKTNKPVNLNCNWKKNYINLLTLYADSSRLI